MNRYDGLLVGFSRDTLDSAAAELFGLHGAEYFIHETNIKRTITHKTCLAGQRMLNEYI